MPRDKRADQRCLHADTRSQSNPWLENMAEELRFLWSYEIKQVALFGAVKLSRAVYVSHIHLNTNALKHELLWAQLK